MNTSDTPVTVSSGYGGNTERGFVSLQMADRKPVTMSPDEARRIAGLLFEAAESADQDHFLVTFFQEQVHVDVEGVVKVLREFRRWRERERSP